MDDQYGQQDYSINYYVVSGSGNSWTVDQFNDEGSYKKANRFSLNSLLNEEYKYGLDLNADGVVGEAVVQAFNSNGNRSLYKLANGDYYFANSGHSRGTDKYNFIDPDSGTNAVKSSIKIENSNPCF